MVTIYAPVSMRAPLIEVLRRTTAEAREVPPQMFPRNHEEDQRAMFVNSVEAMVLDARTRAYKVAYSGHGTLNIYFNRTLFVEESINRLVEGVSHELKEEGFTVKRSGKGSQTVLNISWEQQ